MKLEFLDPAADDGDGEDAGGAMFPTGNRIDALEVPGLGTIEATLINAGNPTIFVDAARLGLSGTELQKDINGDAKILALGRGRAFARRRRDGAGEDARGSHRDAASTRPSSLSSPSRPATPRRTARP